MASHKKQEISISLKKKVGKMNGTRADKCPGLIVYSPEY